MPHHRRHSHRSQLDRIVAAFLVAVKMEEWKVKIGQQVTRAGQK